jgi:hypothetical protein
VRLTIDDIRFSAGCGQQNLGQVWWSELANDVKVKGNDVRLDQSGLSWQLHAAKGRIVAVTFRRKQ